MNELITTLSQGLSQQDVWVSFGLPDFILKLKRHPRFWYVFFVNTNSKLNF